MPENGKKKKNIFRDKQRTNKVLLMFFDVTVCYGKVTIVLLDSVNKQARYSVCV